MTGGSRGGRPPTGRASGEHHRSPRRSRCRHCHEELVHLPHVGWVNPAAGGAYDMCDADPYANHEAIS